MSKASKLASLATDVNELTDLIQPLRLKMQLNEQTPTQN